MRAASGLAPGTTLRACVLALVVAFGLSAASGEEGGALRIAGVAHDPAGSVTVTLLGPGASELPAGSVSALVVAFPGLSAFTLEASDLVTPVRQLLDPDDRVLVG